MGQTVPRPKKPQHKRLTTALVDGKGQNTTTTFQPFIQSNGGDYFFSPSLSLLREIGGVPQAGQGKRKRSDSCSCGDADIYRGKFVWNNRDETPSASNENIWATFPKGRSDGARLVIMTTFTKDDKGTEKAPLTVDYQTGISVEAGSNSFKTTNMGVATSGYSDFFDHVEGKWSDDGQKLELGFYKQGVEVIKSVL